MSRKRIGLQPCLWNTASRQRQHHCTIAASGSFASLRSNVCKPIPARRASANATARAKSTPLAEKISNAWAELIASFDLVAGTVEQLSRDERNLGACRPIPLVQYPERFDKHDARNTHLAGSRDQRACCPALRRIGWIIYERTQQDIRIDRDHFDIAIDKDLVRRVLAQRYRPESGGPSWLTFLGHTKDSLWSVDLLRCESLFVKTHWVMVVMDHCTRRIVGFAVQGGVLDGPSVCRMLNQIFRNAEPLPRSLSTDHDPLFEFHRWKANLRILEIEGIKTVPYVPLSHPFIERLTADWDAATRVLGSCAVLDCAGPRTKAPAVQAVLQRAADSHRFERRHSGGKNGKSGVQRARSRSLSLAISLPRALPSPGSGVRRNSRQTGSLRPHKVPEIRGIRAQLGQVVCTQYHADERAAKRDDRSRWQIGDQRLDHGLTQDHKASTPRALLPISCVEGTSTGTTPALPSWR